ncbi:GDSL-like Lipase/Acylhydrolase family protein [Pseudobutyrivibrio sp. YE44]|uniref:GDSL-type esterase/lipase family protein n=1 Tax=Pseudobutyrivibrio sp. YE44 TaxID=1520802 RepID=UPI0008880C55|nr:GDSL-type esterase/lipase family protein [Pseudobutyrivibrio sp. YE44]SDB33739.1 GDSL-like Lipase/Acylhydrolase family protein [Pseudobutyrivibrio sp. YE44]
MKFRHLLFLILILISAIGLSVCSFWFRPTKYADYSTSVVKEPMVAPLLKAAASGVYPWSEYKAPEVKEATKSASKDEKKEDNASEEAQGDSKEETPEVPRPKSFTQVTDDYFNDAVFIGDSRMLGLSMYCEALDSRATFFAKKSLSIYDIQEKEWVEMEDGRKLTIFDALSEVQFSKVYMEVGINELGRGTNESYAAAYKDVIDRIRAINPDAIIYINSIMFVTKEKSEGDPIYNNGSINVRNMEVVPLADGQHVFFLNINDAIDDGEGNLDASLSGDGVHLKGSCYEPWHQYLLYNAIVE